MTLWKLQKTTLAPLQLIGSGFTLYIGVLIILSIVQFYFDFTPLLVEQTEILKNDTIIITKKISILKNLFKDKIYFSDREFRELEEQDFIRNVVPFRAAGFKVEASTKSIGNIPAYYTEFFFESIPDEYLDVKVDKWHWDSTGQFIPMIIPRDYLNLYNFGFAQSQGLPVLSPHMVSQIKFNISISNHYKFMDFESQIVGFSNKINTILVPDDFLRWANNRFTDHKVIRPSRILLELDNPADDKVLAFLNEKNYSFDNEKLSIGKLFFIFRAAFVFMLFIAVIIIGLSVLFILLSLQLLFERNKEILINLYYIGYGIKVIAKNYLLLASGIFIFVGSLAIVTSLIVRIFYVKQIFHYFNYASTTNIITFLGTVSIILLLFMNFVLYVKIKNIISPE